MEKRLLLLRSAGGFVTLESSEIHPINVFVPVLGFPEPLIFIDFRLFFWVKQFPLESEVGFGFSGAGPSDPYHWIKHQTIGILVRF